jgi:hypothetical protein
MDVRRFPLRQDGESENPRVNETAGSPCRGKPFLLVTFLWAQQRNVTRAKRESPAPKTKRQSPRIPAFARMTSVEIPTFRGNDEHGVPLSQE